MSNSSSFNSILGQYLTFLGSGITYFEGKKKYIATGSLENNKINDYELIDYNSKPSRANMEFKENDIICAKMKNTSKVFLIDEESSNNIYSTGFAGLRVNNLSNLLPKFVFYWLSSHYFQEIKNIYCNGTTQEAITIENLKKIPINCPTLNEQKQIISFLDKKLNEVNINISKNKELISLLEEKKVALINQCVTKGLNPNVPMKDSGVEWIGEIPEHWDIIPFKRILKEIKDGTHGSFDRVTDGEFLLSAKNIFENKINISSNESLINEEDFNKIISNGFPKKNDLLLTIVGTIGRSCVYEYDYPLAFQRSVAFLRLENDVTVYFYNYLVQSDFYINQLDLLSKVSAQKGVYLNDIKESFVFDVPINEQNDIVNYLDINISKIDLLINKVQSQIDLLEEYKQSLIHHVVTGKVDVREVEV